MYCVRSQDNDLGRKAGNDKEGREGGCWATASIQFPNPDGSFVDF